MRRDEFPEMRQLFNFLYTDPRNLIAPDVDDFRPRPMDTKFREFSPVGIIHGTMIEHLNAAEYPLFPDLISPYKPLEVIEIMKKAGKFGVIEHALDGQIKIEPGSDEMHFTNEVGGEVPSRSDGSIVQGVEIRRAFDTYTFEVLCSCKEFKKNKWICGVWHDAIKAEWGLPINNEKYQVEPVDAHLYTLASKVERLYGYKPFGTGPDDFKTPYVLAYLDILDKYPSIQNYVVNFVFTYFSPMFNDLKADVNRKRRACGFEDLQMYDGEIHDGISVKQYVGWRLDNALKSGKKRKGMPTGINDVIETLNFDSPIELGAPSYLRDIDIWE